MPAGAGGPSSVLGKLCWGRWRLDLLAPSPSRRLDPAAGWSSPSITWTSASASPGEAMPSALQGCHCRPQPWGSAGGMPALSPAPSPRSAAPQTHRRGGRVSPHPTGVPGPCPPLQRAGLPWGWGPLRGHPIHSMEGMAEPQGAALSLPQLLSWRLCLPHCGDSVSPSWGLPQKPPCPKQQLP